MSEIRMEKPERQPEGLLLETGTAPSPRAHSIPSRLLLSLGLYRSGTDPEPRASPRPLARGSSCEHSGSTTTVEGVAAFKPASAIR